MISSAVESVRARPAMYVGDTLDGSGLHHLLWELVANALDGVLAGHATRVDVTFHEGGAVSVDDDGAGMPIHRVDGVSFAEVALTRYHDSGTLDGHRPHVHLGPRSVGAVVVNALSASLELDVFRHGRHHRERYVAGVPEAPLEDVGATERSGTRITFVPDPTIFRQGNAMSFALVDERLREIALLNAGAHLALHDHRTGNDERGEPRSHHHPEGLRGFLDHSDDAFTCQGVANDIRLDVALRWSTAEGARAALRSFANTEATTGHGTHVEGLMRGVVDAVAADLPEARRTSAAARDALARDLAAVVHVSLADPYFEGPTRDRLLTPEAAEAVRTVVAAQLAVYLEPRTELRAVLVERLGLLP